MGAVSSPPIKQRFFDNDGNPLAGGKVWTYAAGSGGATLKTSYKDKSLTSTNTNPITLDGRGECDLWLDGVYLITVKDAAGNTIMTHDNIGGMRVANGVATVAALAASGVGNVGDVQILLEAGRAGLFAWNGANLSAKVTEDPYQGIYVAPTTAPTGASGAWVRQFDGGEAQASWFGANGGATKVGSVWVGTDETARLSSAIAHSDVKVLRLAATHYMINTMAGSCLLLTSGKSLIGVSRELTWLHKVPLPGASTQGGPVGGIEINSGALGVTIADLSFDGQSSGAGRGDTQRCHGFILVPHRGCSVRRVQSYNVTGYAFWANGGSSDVDGLDASTVLEDCYAENFQVAFETTFCRDVRLERCISQSAPQTGNTAAAIAPSSHFHPYGATHNVTYQDCKAAGTGIGLEISLSVGSLTDISIDNMQCVMTGTVSPAFVVNANATANTLTNLFVSNSKFEDMSTSGASFQNTTGVITNTVFRGANGVTTSNSPIHFGNCIAYAYTDPAGATFAVAVAVSSGTAWWDGGEIKAEGKPAATPYGGDIRISANTDITPPVAATAPARTNITMGTGWTSGSAGYGTAQVCKRADTSIMLSGTAQGSGTATLTIGTLPVGFRPSVNKFLTVPVGTGLASITITPAGTIVLTTGASTTALVGLDNVEFWPS